jgi:hypothetical protein
MCIDNNAVINNNYGSFQDLTLLFKISEVPRNNFLEIHRQFGHGLSKMFTSPAILISKREESSHMSGIKKRTY